MMTVAAIAMVFIIANVDTVAAQGVDCYDACNTACVGLPTREYLRCDEKCRIRCGPDGKIDCNLVEGDKKYNQAIEAFVVEGISQ